MVPSLMHQKQPCQRSCMCTSVAMILNIPAQVVINKYHDKIWNEGWDLHAMLTDLGVEFFSYDSAKLNGLNTQPTGYYLVAVPSLNSAGGMHQIVVEIDAELGTQIVYDPQEGTGYMFYSTVALPRNPSALKFGGGYTLEVGILKESVAAWKLLN